MRAEPSGGNTAERQGAENDEMRKEPQLAAQREVSRIATQRHWLPRLSYSAGCFLGLKVNLIWEGHPARLTAVRQAFPQKQDSNRPELKASRVPFRKLRLIRINGPKAAFWLISQAN